MVVEQFRVLEVCLWVLGLLVSSSSSSSLLAPQELSKACLLVVCSHSRLLPMIDQSSRPPFDDKVRTYRCNMDWSGFIHLFSLCMM